MLYNLGKFVCSIILFFFYPFNVFGSQNLPKHGKAIIVANHSSNWDPIIIAMLTYRKIHYLGKAELFKIPLLAWFFRQVQVIPVERNKVKPRTIIDCMKLLKNGHILGIFPEGKRVKEGENVEPMDGFVTFALRQDAPIIPIHIEGKIRPWHRINIIIGKPIDLTATYGNKVKDSVQKRIASQIMNEIYALKTP